ncbi:TrkH family potassium uptake protein [Desulfocurvibacter africanus]|uniref:TrkH family potassium uptake protein n=1 Tax=Desulfocurvibacter africanus TaxID=873 RepID=UPI000400EAE2|nr:TrkH family potassium uptake protein [Desulfocurvibacter africanus]
MGYLPGPALRLRTMFSYAGLIWTLVGLLMLASLAVLPFADGEAAWSWAFLYPASALLLGGLTTWRVARPRTYVTLTLQDGGVVVLLGWIVCCLAATWPFLSILDLTFTQALFETVSGFTTTGLSVVDVTTAPKVVLLWRSLMQLAGGAGLAIIMLAAIAGPAGTSLSGAEGRSDQLAPHVRSSATLVLVIYSAYALAGSLAYRIAGMEWFDAVNHAFAAISTGGFSTRPESIGYWNSSEIELVTVVLMILGNLNFVTAYLLLTGKWRSVLKNGELRFSLLLFLAAAGLLFWFVTHHGYTGLGKQVRVALFEAVTAATTTGFSTVGYTGWPAIGWLVMLLLMLVGGGTGSTAGGIKQYRVYLLIKSVWWEIKRALLPRGSVPAESIWMGERPKFIDDSDLRRATCFVTLYLVCFTLGVGIMVAYGYPLRESLFEYASSIGTVGLSIGITSADAPPAVLWTQIMGMFLGRLEFFIVFIAALHAGRIVLPIISRRKRPARS